VKQPDQTDPALAPVRVSRMWKDGTSEDGDVLAVEEPLEIRLGHQVDGRREHVAVSVTMCSPGHAEELAVGFLFTEGIISSPQDVAGIHTCGKTNAVRVDLAPTVAVDFERLKRHVYTTSSCGVCGKTSLEAVRVRVPTRMSAGRPIVSDEMIRRLPEKLRLEQSVFDQTGGLHASALFDVDGTLLCLREDVGRHNALDKLIGAEFLAGRTPLSDSGLLLSGRVSFELVQKAAVAGIPIVVAVGAPSSLAVELAREHGMTLIGFLRHHRFNVYCGGDRVRPRT
jgi:FdhD protein